jgi:hypothetical protein
MKSKSMSDARVTLHLNFNADTSGGLIELLPALIRKRAYDLYERRGRHPGHEIEDWMRAEREIKHHFNLP